MIDKILKIDKSRFSREEYLNIRYIFISIIGFSFVLLFAAAALYYSMRSWVSVMAALLVIPLLLLSLILLRSNKTIHLAQNIVILIIFGLTYFVVLYSGGITTPIAFWLTSLPVLVGLFTTRKKFFWWIGLLYLMVLFLPIYQFYFVDSSYDFISDKFGFMRFRIIFFLITLSSFLIYVYRGMMEASLAIIKEKQQKLNQKKNQLNSLLKLIGHDLATPLSVISLSIKKLEKEPSSSKSIEMIKSAARSIEQILLRTKALKAIEEGKVILDLKQNNLFQMCQESITYFTPLFENKNLQVIFEIDQDIMVTVDRLSFIHQVLNNILSNAIKFSHKGGKIKLQATKENTQVIFRVQDHGVGMPKDMAESIFDYNKVISRKGTNNEAGTGFGISLIKEYVDHYGAKIKVESVENSGTSIILAFPSNL